MTFSEWLTSLGIDESAMTAEGIELMQKQYEMMQEPATVPAEAQASALVNMRASTSSELTRQSQILSACAGYPHIARAGIENGWSVLECENHVLKAKARHVTATNFPSTGRSGGLTKNHLSASLMLRAGGESAAVKAFGADICQQARELRCTNLVDLAAHSLTIAGQDPQAFQNHDQMLRAAFSTANLPTILSDATGKSLVAAYEETTSDWKRFCHIGDAANFKEQKGVRPAAIASLDQVGAGGTIKHGALLEEDVYEWSVDTFAKMLSVTRRDIINDDLGFIETVAPMLGTAAGRSLLDLIWSTILGGVSASFFSVPNANYSTGATTNLSGESLAVGIAAMRNQRDSKGNDINIKPAVLAVPSALESTALALLNSREILGTSGPSGNPNYNIVPHLAVEPRLSNSTRFSSTSEVAWYLFGGPQTRPVTVGFLRGQQTPTIEVADADFNTLGIQMRAFFDYGVALADPKAAYKSKGSV